MCEGSNCLKSKKKASSLVLRILLSLCSSEETILIISCCHGLHILLALDKLLRSCLLFWLLRTDNALCFAQWAVDLWNKRIIQVCFHMRVVLVCQRVEAVWQRIEHGDRLRGLRTEKGYHLFDGVHLWSVWTSTLIHLQETLWIGTVIHLVRLWGVPLPNHLFQLIGVLVVVGYRIFDGVDLHFVLVRVLLVAVCPVAMFESGSLEDVDSELYILHHKVLQ